MIDFTSRQLRAFLLVAEHGSFTRAAGSLFITPSGLSILIKELERQIGARLFERTTRRVELTERGKVLAVAVKRALLDLDNALTGAGKAGGQNASLALGVPLFWASGEVAKAIKEFRVRKPELRLRLFDGDAGTILRKVESGELDLGLGFFFKHVPGIRRMPLFRFSLMVIRPRTRGGDSRSRVTTWAGLRGEKLIALQPNLPLQQLINRHLARARISGEPALTVNYLHTQIAMVESGEGAAIIPSFAASECLKKDISISELRNPVVHLDLYQIRRGGSEFSSQAESFTVFLGEYLARLDKNASGAR